MLNIKLKRIVTVDCRFFLSAEQPVQSCSVDRDNLCNLVVCGAESFVSISPLFPQFVTPFAIFSPI